jgi:NAD(P)-dependent dehydrogenase (short-subunit alcohol dehydrogenase family)
MEAVAGFGRGDAVSEDRRNRMRRCTKLVIMDLQLKDKVAVITGASKGIGLATARTLLEEGARVVAASRTLTPELEALSGPRLVHVPADVIDPAAPARVVERAAAEFGGLDVLARDAAVRLLAGA